MCRPRECPRLEEIRGKLRTRVCIHFPAGALQPEAWHLPSVFRYSHTSQELHWTRLTTPRVLWVTVTPLITMAVAISPSFSGHENYVLTSRLQEGREGCRNGSKTRIDRERERTSVWHRPIVRDRMTLGLLYPHLVNASSLWTLKIYSRLTALCLPTPY